MAVVRRTRTPDANKAPSELKEVLSQIRKRYGDNTVVNGDTIRQPWRIPTGIFTFDYATLGGIPHNRVTMFHGPKHSGKTTASLRCIAGAQQSLPDQQAVLVDIEGTFDSTWAEKVGVNTSELNVAAPDTGEHAVDLTVGLIHAREVSLVVIDSLAAMLPIKESESSAEDSLVGQQSRLITSMLRKTSAALIQERKRGHYVTLVLINQQRAKIGGWAPPGGEALSNPGGKAVGFFTSLEARWKNKELVKKDDAGFDTLECNEHAFAIEKNKMNGGMRTGEFRMMRRADEEMGLTEGQIDDASTMVAFAKKLGWLTGGGRGGQTISFGDYEVQGANGMELAKALYADPDMYWRFRCHLIADHAERQGMKPEFVHYLRGEG